MGRDRKAGGVPSILSARLGFPRLHRRVMAGLLLLAHGLLAQDLLIPAEVAAAGTRLPPIPEPGRVPPRLSDESIIDSLVAQVSADTLVASVRYLEDLGTRNAAKPGAHQAAAWLASRFRSYGVQDVEIQTWSGTYAGNVVATLPGTGASPDVYLLGAHYDSRTAIESDDEPGADDNASGTATLLECARLLAPHRLAATVRFVAFSAEEYGLLGSEAYAAQADATLEPIAAMINLDMLGYLAPGDRRDLDVIADQSSLWLFEATTNVAARYVPAFPVIRAKLLAGTSDHASFWAHGFYAVFFHEDAESNSPFLHTAEDVIGLSYNDPELHAQCTRVALALLATLAGADVVPVTLETLAARRDGAVVRLEWRLSADARAGTAGVGVQRALAAPGPWEDRTAALLDAAATSFADAAPAGTSALWYRLVLAQRSGESWFSAPVRAVAAVARTGFEAVFAPHPADPIHIRYRVAEPADRLRLGVYDVRGRLVRVLLDETRAPGAYLHTWDRRDDGGHPLSRGVYVLRLQAPGTMDARKVVVMPAPSQ